MGRWAGPKYPEGPPANYDPENPHADPVALLEHREYEVRRKEVGVAKAQVQTYNICNTAACTRVLRKTLPKTYYLADTQGQGPSLLYHGGC